MVDFVLKIVQFYKNVEHKIDHSSKSKSTEIWFFLLFNTLRIFHENLTIFPLPIALFKWEKNSIGIFIPKYLPLFKLCLSKENSTDVRLCIYSKLKRDECLWTFLQLTCLTTHSCVHYHKLSASLTSIQAQVRRLWRILSLEYVSIDIYSQPSKQFHECKQLFWWLWTLVSRPL